MKALEGDLQGLAGTQVKAGGSPYPKMSSVGVEMLRHFETFCRSMGHRLPRGKFLAKGSQLIQGQEWRGDARALTGALLIFLKENDLETDYDSQEFDEEDRLVCIFRSYTISPPVLAKLLGCTSAAITRAYHLLLAQLPKACTSNAEKIYTNQTADARRIVPLPVSSARLKQDRAAVLYAILVCFKRNFSVEFDEYDPNFLQWLCAHRCWDSNWKMVYWYLVEYLYYGAGHWIIEEYIEDLHAHLEFSIATSPALRGVVRREVLAWVRAVLEATIAQVLQQQGIAASETPNFLRLFEEYANGTYLAIPPWRSPDLELTARHAPTITRIFEALKAARLYYRGVRLQWLDSHFHKDRQWQHFEEPYRPNQTRRFTVYYTHSRRIQGTPREQEELDLIRAQFARTIEEFTLSNPATFEWTRLGITDGPQKMEYCLRYIREQVDFLVFSEFEGYLGKGVYLEVQAAREKGIPILLLRDRQFWLCPQVVVHDATDWAFKFGQVSMLPHKAVKEVRELLLVDR